MDAAHDISGQSTPLPASVDPQRPVPSWLTAMFAAIDAFDVERFLTFLSPDCEFRFGNAPSIYGHATIGKALSRFFAAIKGIRHTELEAWEHPDATICSGKVTYVRQNETELAVPFAVILRLDGQLVRQYLIFVDHSALFV